MRVIDLFRKKIKLRTILITLAVTIIIACSIGVGSYGYVNGIKDPLEPKEDITIAGVNILVDETTECHGNPVYYAPYKNSNIYLYCLDNFLITTNDDSCMELSTYLDLEPNAIELITVNFMQKIQWPSDFNIPGTTLFQGSDFRILKCFSEQGNKDIYIGDKSLEYFDDFCK